jgi:hypothetical protein
MRDYAMSKEQKTEEAKIGARGEELLIKVLMSRKDVVACVEHLAGAKIENVAGAARGATRGLIKTDVVVTGSTGVSVGISLKTIKARGRPDVHLDRRWLDKSTRRLRPWSEVLQMPIEIVEILQSGILNIAAGRSTQLVPNVSDQQKVSNFIRGSLHRFLEEAFKNADPELRVLAILEYNERLTLCMFNVDEVIDFIEQDVAEAGISFGNRINIGNYIQLQRKAGDGKHVKKPKTSPDHPGNQVQVKFLAKNFVGNARNMVRNCCFELASLLEKPSAQKKLANFI